jgi:hypothetical protein
MSLPLPAFPLTGRIHLRRQSLIENEVWEDRSEDIGTDAQQFIEQVERREGIYR